jgi:hypothetical protein
MKAKRLKNDIYGRRVMRKKTGKADHYTVSANGKTIPISFPPNYPEDVVLHAINSIKPEMINGHHAS